MRNITGLWIDHRKAVVVAITEQGEKTSLITSKVEKQLRRAGDSPLKGPYEPQQVAADDSRQRALTGHLRLFYDEVIACIGDAESILIFGPGAAKGELKKYVEGQNHYGRIVSVDTVGRMTNRQIAAKVRGYFANGLERTKSANGSPIGGER